MKVALASISAFIGVLLFITGLAWFAQAKTVPVTTLPMRPLLGDFYQPYPYWINDVCRPGVVYYGESCEGAARI